MSPTRTRRPEPHLLLLLLRPRSGRRRTNDRPWIVGPLIGHLVGRRLVGLVELSLLFGFVRRRRRLVGLLERRKTHCAVPNADALRGSSPRQQDAHHSRPDAFAQRMSHGKNLDP